MESDWQSWLADIMRISVSAMSILELRMFTSTVPWRYAPGRSFFPNMTCTRKKSFTSVMTYQTMRWWNVPAVPAARKTPVQKSRKSPLMWVIMPVGTAWHVTFWSRWWRRRENGCWMKRPLAGEKKRKNETHYSCQQFTPPAWAAGRFESGFWSTCPARYSGKLSPEPSCKWSGRLHRPWKGWRI